MRSLRRPAAPAILTENKGRWTAAFLEKKAAKPKGKHDPKHHRHEQIVTALAAMSFHKCFYCEQKLGERQEVDHYVEVSEAPERAFDWTNLYLACFECNRRKRPNTERPASECVDPCDSAEDPAEHLTFDDEFIRARTRSPRGLATIQKYLLDREDLTYKRGRQLSDFLRAFNEILKGQVREGRPSLSSEETELLAAFADPDRPYSLMFRVLLARHGLDSDASQRDR